MLTLGFFLRFFFCKSGPLSDHSDVNTPTFNVFDWWDATATQRTRCKQTSRLQIDTRYLP